MNTTNKTKKCSKCLQEKCVTLFYNNKRSKDNLSYWCKECQKIYIVENSELYQKHRKKNYIKRKQQNPEKIRKTIRDNIAKLQGRNRNYIKNFLHTCGCFECSSKNTKNLSAYRINLQKINIEKIKLHRFVQSPCKLSKLEKILQSSVVLCNDCAIQNGYENNSKKRYGKYYAKIFTKDFLIQELIYDKKRISEIAKTFNCNRSTINRYIKQHNINHLSVL